MLQCNFRSAAFPKTAAQLSVFFCGMLQGWSLEGWGLGLAEKNPKKPKMITSHDDLEPLKQALCALRDVTILSQIAARTCKLFFTLGDGCRLPYGSHFFC